MPACGTARNGNQSCFPSETAHRGSETIERGEPKSGEDSGHLVGSFLKQVGAVDLEPFVNQLLGLLGVGALSRTMIGTSMEPMFL